MKVTVTTIAGGQGIVLADDSLGHGVGSKQFGSATGAFDAILQESVPIDGTAPVLFDRLNESFRGSISVLYRHDSADAAYGFWMSLQSTVPRIGNVTIETGGSYKRTRMMLNCWLRPITIEQWLGVSVLVRFNLTAGLIVTAPTTPSGVVTRA